VTIAAQQSAAVLRSNMQLAGPEILGKNVGKLYLSLKFGEFPIINIFPKLGNISQNREIFPEFGEISQIFFGPTPYDGLRFGYLIIIFGYIIIIVREYVPRPRDHVPEFRVRISEYPKFW
jgi:hypothetical protein